jgi:SAM-dependent methyltransferase
MHEMICPLCRSENSILLQHLKTEPLVSRWKNQFGIDIGAEFGGVPSLELRVCRACGLGYFLPDGVAGSPALYEQLGKCDWYYLHRKWEHDVALQDFDGCMNGIELGCGFGDFVARVIQEKKVSFEGCEQNPSAVEIARQNGISVHLETAEELAKTRPGKYSVVCAFQVLEHLSRPADFLDASCKLLKPGGKLMLGVPNAKSFLRHQSNLLDMPPHHVTRWTAEVLSRLPQWFPLKLVRTAYEPLADYHVDGYVEAYANLFATRTSRVFSLPKVQSLIAGLIRTSGIQRTLRGQTIYACYVRV